MKKIICMVLCALLVLSALGCSGEEKGTEMKVYYINPDGNGLVEEKYYRQAESGDEAIEEVIRILQNPMDKASVRSAIPEEVEILGFEVEKEILKLTFSEAYTELRASAEVLLRAAIVQSLVQLPDAEYVMIYIEDEPLRNLSGDVVGRMDEESFVQNTGSTLKTYQTIDLKIYLPNEDGTKLQVEHRNKVRYNINTSVEKLVVESLMKKNKNPSTVQLIGVTVKDGICYVNFNSAFLTEGDFKSPETAIYSIVNSVIANGTVQRVQILVDGSSDVVYKGTVDLSKPFSWKSGLIEG